MTDAQLAYEAAIEWRMDEALAFPYVRESSATTRTLDGPPPSHNGILVGYALLRGDTPTVPGPCPVRRRRYFWLKESDRAFDPDGVFADKVPAEAVDPLTVAVGQLGRRTQRMFAEVGR